MTTSLLGAALALLVFLLSTSPSLLPRPWWAQGIFSGCLMVGAYVAGFLIDWVARTTYKALDMHVTYDHQLATYARAALYLAVVVVFLVALVRNYLHMRLVARMVDMAAPTPASLLAALVTACAVAAVVVGVYALIYRVWNMASRLIARWVPHNVAALIAWAVVLVLAYALVRWGVVRAAIAYTDRQAARLNRVSPAHVHAPRMPQRSASPSSCETWESTGREGKRFLGGAPMLPRLQRMWGGGDEDAAGVREPIRIYISRRRGEAIADMLERLRSELARTDALSRRALLVVVPTGSGWVDEWNAQAFEYLTRGDCATLALQYSYLPSWLTFVSRRDAAAEGGRRSVRLVADMVEALPPSSRPRLYVTGESLGSFGGQAAFDSPEEMLERIDGALWIGTPGFTPLRSRLAASRHRGSPQIAPVVDNARHVRFATRPADLVTDLYGRQLGRWDFPRVVYAQHASDPVAWWSPRLAWAEPDWIGERAGRDVSPHLRWHRLITCGQVLCDLPLAESAPSGHGHSYHRELIPAWRAILGLGHEGDYSEANRRIGDAIADHLT